MAKRKKPKSTRNAKPDANLNDMSNSTHKPNKAAEKKAESQITPESDEVIVEAATIDDEGNGKPVDDIKYGSKDEDGSDDLGGKDKNISGGAGSSINWLTIVPVVAIVGVAIYGYTLINAANKEIKNLKTQITKLNQKESTDKTESVSPEDLQASTQAINNKYDKLASEIATITKAYDQSNKQFNDVSSNIEAINVTDDVTRISTQLQATDQKLRQLEQKLTINDYGVKPATKVLAFIQLMNKINSGQPYVKQADFFANNVHSLSQSITFFAADGLPDNHRLLQMFGSDLQKTVTNSQTGAAKSENAAPADNQDADNKNAGSKANDIWNGIVSISDNVATRINDSLSSLVEVRDRNAAVDFSNKNNTDNKDARVMIAKAITDDNLAQAATSWNMLTQTEKKLTDNWKKVLDQLIQARNDISDLQNDLLRVEAAQN